MRMDWTPQSFLWGVPRRLVEARWLSSRNVEDGLQLLDQSPLFHRHLRSVELLQCVDTGTRDVRVQLVLFFQVAAVHGLVGALNFDGDRGLTLLANRDRLVLTFD